MSTFGVTTDPLPSMSTAAAVRPKRKPAPALPAAPPADDAAPTPPPSGYTPPAPRPIPYSDDEPPEAHAAREQRAAAVDQLVAKSRLAQPPGVIDQRRVPRLSPGEINGLNDDDIADRFKHTSTDDRGPFETVIDWVDLARNANANIAFGHPTAAGIIGGYGEAAAAFGTAGFFVGGPPGALVGAGVGLAVQGAENLGALIMRGLTPESVRDEIDKEAPQASAGEKRIFLSDALDKMGIKSGVAKAILGFAGDVAMDPLTYVGPPGFATSLTAKTVEGGVAHIGLRGAFKGVKAASFAEAAAGSVVKDAEVGAWLAEKGYGQEAVKARLAKGATEAEIQNEISRAFHGENTNWKIAKPFTVLGHESKFEGGEFIKDVLSNDGSAASKAAMAIHAKYGQGISEPGLRLFMKEGDAGLKLAHIPFTDFALTVPDLARANGVARMGMLVSGLREAGLASDAQHAPEATTNFEVALKQQQIANEFDVAAAENMADQARHEELVKAIREQEPPVPVPVPPPAPTPIHPPAAVPPEKPFAVGDMVNTKVGAEHFPSFGEPRRVTDVQVGSDGRTYVSFEGSKTAFPSDVLENFGPPSQVADVRAAAGTTSSVSLPPLDPAAMSTEALRAELATGPNEIVNLGEVPHDTLVHAVQNMRAGTEVADTTARAAADLRANAGTTTPVDLPPQPIAAPPEPPAPVIPASAPTENELLAEKMKTTSSPENMMEVWGQQSPENAAALDAAKAAKADGDREPMANIWRSIEHLDPHPTMAQRMKRVRIDFPNMSEADIAAQAQKEAREAEDASEPLTRELARRQKYLVDYQAQQEARIAASEAQAKRGMDAFKSMDEAKYAATPQDAATMLRVGNAAQDAGRQINELRDQLRQHMWIMQHMPEAASMKPEEIARHVELKLYELHRTDPKAAMALTDAVQARAEALTQARGILRGQLLSLTTAEDSGIREYAKMMLSTDNANVAMSALGRASEMLRGTDFEVFADVLDGANRYLSRTFNIKGGHLQDALARSKADAGGTNRMKMLRWNQELTGKAKAIIGAKMSTAALDDAMHVFHGLVIEAADPEHAHWSWTIPDARGPAHAKPSLLFQRMVEAQKSGILADDGVAKQLRALAQQEVQKLHEMGDYALKDGLLDMLASHYVPLTPTAEAEAEFSKVKRWGLDLNESTRRVNAGKRPFQLARLTHRTYFPDPASITKETPEATWKWFHQMDRWLVENHAEQIEAAGDKAGEVFRTLAGGDAKKAKVYADAYDAMKSYDKAVAADPTFARTYFPKPIDFMEANRLHRDEDRFATLMDSTRDVEKMFEGNYGIVAMKRIAAHERAAGWESIRRTVDATGHEIDPKLFVGKGQAGMQAKLKNGKGVTLIGGVRTNAGSEVPAVKIGDKVYRLLDEKTRTSLIGDALGEERLNGLLLPTELADKIEDVARVSTPGGEMERALRGVDKITQAWKSLTMFRLSRTVVETVGNTWLALAGGARIDDLVRTMPLAIQLRRFIKNPELAKNLKVTLSDGRAWSGEDFLRMMQHLGLIDVSFPHELMGQMVRQNPSIMKKSSTVLEKVVAPTHIASAYAWDTVRMATFLSHAEQGHDVTSAARKTMDSLFDWTDYGKMEEQVFRRLMPFFSWVRFNLGYQMQLLLDRPILAASTPLLSKAIEEAVASNSAVPKEDQPQWMREEMATQLTNDPDTRVGLMFNQLMPQSEVLAIMQPIVGVEGALRFANIFASSLNPVLSVPLQLGVQRDFFSNRSIGADEASGDESVGQFLGGQIGPIGYGTGIAKGFQRSAATGVGRVLLGGRIQAMDDARLASTKDREDREKESRLRAAVSKNTRAGNSDAAITAKARLLHLYQDRRKRGLHVPKWAADQLATMESTGAT